MSGTEDLFTPVHKGIRAMIYDLSARLQTNDFTDPDSTQALAQDLEIDFAIARSAGCFLCAFAAHAHDEERVVFPRSAEAANALVTELIRDHQGLTRRELEIGQHARALGSISSPGERTAAGIRLNQLANELFAAYLVHMNREETELVPVMREHFTDAEQAQMRGAIIAGFQPDRLFALLGWMLPALNVSELTELLASVKGAAPPPFMKAISDIGAAHVDAERWAVVKQRVGI